VCFTTESLQLKLVSTFRKMY